MNAADKNRLAAMLNRHEDLFSALRREADAAARAALNAELEALEAEIDALTAEGE